MRLGWRELIATNIATVLCMLMMLSSSRGPSSVPSHSDDSSSLQDTGRVCFPYTVPLVSRFMFPEFATRLLQYKLSAMRSRRKRRRSSEKGVPLRPPPLTVSKVELINKNVDDHDDFSSDSSLTPFSVSRPLRIAEIGANRCSNAFSMLTMLADCSAVTYVELYLIDSWGRRGAESGTKEEGYPDNNDDLEGLHNYNRCKQLLSRAFPGSVAGLNSTISRNAATQVQLLRMVSAKAALLFPDEFFDFVYIDALHTYTMSKQDLIIWWPKVAPGGLFAGDDLGGVDMSKYLASAEQRTLYNVFFWGVTTALKEFIEEKNIPFMTTFAETKVTPRVVQKMQHWIDRITEEWKALSPEQLLAISSETFPAYFADPPIRGEPNFFAVKPFDELYDSSCRSLVNRQMFPTCPAEAQWKMKKSAEPTSYDGLPN
jgi:hypothetical protein